ncbi:MAG TPA: hypothetical protein VM166_06440 [Gemmatimonadaceae bacterium]|nr:hypothetical protein [Gemmatimonadaceae bacterium]
MLRKTAYFLALALLAFTGVVGIYNGIDEWGDPTNAVQESVLIGVLAYGLLGLVGVYGVVRRERWRTYAVAAWGIAVTYVPGAAVMAYTEEGVAVGSAIAASGAAALVAAFVLWAITSRTAQSDRPKA